MQMSVNHQITVNQETSSRTAEPGSGEGKGGEWVTGKREEDGGNWFINLAEVLELRSEGNAALETAEPRDGTQ